MVSSALQKAEPIREGAPSMADGRGAGEVPRPLALPTLKGELPLTVAEGGRAWGVAPGVMLALLVTGVVPLNQGGGQGGVDGADGQRGVDGDILYPVLVADVDGDRPRGAFRNELWAGPGNGIGTLVCADCVSTSCWEVAGAFFRGDAQESGRLKPSVPEPTIFAVPDPAIVVAQLRLKPSIPEVPSSIPRVISVMFSCPVKRLASISSHTVRAPRDRSCERLSTPSSALKYCVCFSLM